LSKFSVSELPDTDAVVPDRPLPTVSEAAIVSSASEIWGDVRVFVPSRINDAV
jgi:hypothetical protein